MYVKTENDYCEIQIFFVIYLVQNMGRYSESLLKCDNLMNFVNKLPEKYEKDKPRLIGNIHSNKGNAYLELGKYDLALQSHQKDLEIAIAK